MAETTTPTRLVPSGEVERPTRLVPAQDVALKPTRLVPVEQVTSGIEAPSQDSELQTKRLVPATKPSRLVSAEQPTLAPKPPPPTEEERLTSIHKNVDRAFTQIEKNVSTDPIFFGARGILERPTGNALEDYFRKRVNQIVKEEFGNKVKSTQKDFFRKVKEEVLSGMTLRIKDQLANKRAKTKLENMGFSVDLTQPGSEAQFRDEVRVQRQMLGLSDDIPIGSDPSGLKQIGKFANVLRAAERQGQAGLMNLFVGLFAPELNQKVQDEIQQRLQSNPDLAESFIFNIFPGMASGSLLVIASGPFAPLTGALQSAGQARTEARAAGATGGAEFLNTVGNGIIGAAEGLFFKSASLSAAAFKAGAYRTFAKHALKTALVEAVQEAGQQGASNALAMALFDYQRSLLEGITPEMLAGSAIIGGGVPVVMSGVGKSVQATNAILAKIEARFKKGGTFTASELEQFASDATKDFAEAVESVVQPLSVGAPESLAEQPLSVVAPEALAEPPLSVAAPESLAEPPPTPLEQQDAKDQEQETGGTADVQEQPIEPIPKDKAEDGIEVGEGTSEKVTVPVTGEGSGVDADTQSRQQLQDNLHKANEALQVEATSGRETKSLQDAADKAKAELDNFDSKERTDAITPTQDQPQATRATRQQLQDKLNKANMALQTEVLSLPDPISGKDTKKEARLQSLADKAKAELDNFDSKETTDGIAKPQTPVTEEVSGVEAALTETEAGTSFPFVDAVTEIDEQTKKEVTAQVKKDGGMEVKRDDGTLQVTLTPSTREGVLVQVTIYDSNGKPSGHSDHNSIESAVDRIIEETGDKLRRPDIPDDLAFRDKPGGLFVYQPRLRPPGPGTVPNGGLVKTGKGGKHGEVFYDRPLTPKELADFELTPIRFEEDSGPQQKPKKQAKPQTPVTKVTTPEPKKQEPKPKAKPEPQRKVVDDHVTGTSKPEPNGAKPTIKSNRSVVWGSDMPFEKMQHKKEHQEAMNEAWKVGLPIDTPATIEMAEHVQQAISEGKATNEVALANADRAVEGEAITEVEFAGILAVIDNHIASLSIIKRQIKKAKGALKAELKTQQARIENDLHRLWEGGRRIGSTGSRILNLMKTHVDNLLNVNEVLEKTEDAAKRGDTKVSPETKAAQKKDVQKHNRLDEKIKQVNRKADEAMVAGRMKRAKREHGDKTTEQLDKEMRALAEEQDRLLGPCSVNS